MTIGPAEATVNAVVMGHPSRQTSAEGLARTLGGCPAVLDPLPEGPTSSRRTVRAAWARAPAEATHLLVVQDDAIAAAWTMEEARQLATLFPHAAVSLFSEWATRSASLARTSCLVGATVVPVCDPFTPSVALMMPRQLADDFAADDRWPDQQDDDKALARFLHEREVPAYLSVPNLTDHGDLPSLVISDPVRGEFMRPLRRSAAFHRPSAPWRLVESVRFTPSHHPIGGVSLVLRDEQGRWSDSPTAELLRARRWDGQQLRQALQQYVARAPFGDWRTRLACSHRPCVGLVVRIAMLHGLCLRASTDAQCAPSPSAVRLFESMVWGCLRTFHPSTVLQDRAHDLAEPLLAIALDTAEAFV